jgi:hypothetical protein
MSQQISNGSGIVMIHGGDQELVQLLLSHLPPGQENRGSGDNRHQYQRHQYGAFASHRPLFLSLSLIQSRDQRPIERKLALLSMKPEANNSDEADQY